MSLSLEYFGEDQELHRRALRFRPQENEDDIEADVEEETMPVDQVADLLDDMLARLKASQNAGVVRESMATAEWIEYAEKKRIGMPWMAWARHRKHWPRTPGAPKAEPAAPATASGTTRGNKTLLRLVAVMAKGGYGYDPAALKSPVPKQIADDAERHGHPVDVDTVLKWLRRANEEFPAAEPKPKSV
jgi:hypothetical protein